MLSLLLRHGFRKGVLGGNRRWLVVGGAALGVRVLGRLARREPEVVYCEELSPGEALVVAHDRDATMEA